MAGAIASCAEMRDEQGRIAVEQIERRLEPRLQRVAPFGRRIVDADGVPGRRQQVGDAVAHQARADHADVLRCHCFAFACLDRRPDAVRRRRHVDVLDAVVLQRVHDRVHHHGQRRRDAGLAAALDAQRIALGRIFRQRDVEHREHGARAACRSP